MSKIESLRSFLSVGESADVDADVVDISELPEQDEGPVINIDVTGTSIRTTHTNNEDDDGEAGTHENGKEEIDDSTVQEELFVEEDIPDISDEEDD